MPGLHITEESLRLAHRPLFRARAQQITLPARIDHRAELLESSDQGDTSMCAAMAMAGAVEFARWRNTGMAVQVDPKPIYDLAKTKDGISGEGTTLEAVLYAAEEMGLIEPIAEHSVELVERPDDVKRALHQHGVVLAGFDIDESWALAMADGWIKGGGDKLGGHAVLVCAYDTAERWFGMQNSWGKDGYGWRGFVRLSPELFSAQYRYGLVWSYA